MKDGLYVSNWYGGMTSMEQFTFSAGEASVIRNGRVEELMRPVLLTGNLFTTLESLDAVANDLDMNQGGGVRQRRSVAAARIQRQPPHKDPRGASLAAGNVQPDEVLERPKGWPHTVRSSTCPTGTNL